MHSREGDRPPVSTVELSTMNGERAFIDPNGGFVNQVLAKDGTNLLFPRQDIGPKNRGGIPLCLPVFGPGNAVGLPQHGFARTLEWQAVPADANVVSLFLDHPRKLNPDLPTQYDGCKTSVDIYLESREGGIELTTTARVGNHGSDSFILTPGFHPYFPAPQGEDTELALKYHNTLHAYKLAEVSDAKQLPAVDSRDAVLEFAIPGYEVQMTVNNLYAPVLWTDRPHDYFCIEPTLAGAVTGADVPERTLEQFKLNPGESRLFGMQIRWTPQG